MHILLLETDNNPSWRIKRKGAEWPKNYFVINLHESMGPGRDQTHGPWICSQTRICCQTRYLLCYMARRMLSFNQLFSCFSLTQAPQIDMLVINIWAATCDFQQCGILTSVDSEEPMQPRFKVRNSKWCSVRLLKRNWHRINIHKSMGPGWDQTQNPCICNQTHL